MMTHMRRHSSYREAQLIAALAHVAEQTATCLSQEPDPVIARVSKHWDPPETLTTPKHVSILCDGKHPAPYQSFKKHNHKFKRNGRHK